MKGLVFLLIRFGFQNESVVSIFGDPKVNLKIKYLKRMMNPSKILPKSKKKWSKYEIYYKISSQYVTSILYFEKIEMGWRCSKASNYERSHFHICVLCMLQVLIFQNLFQVIKMLRLGKMPHLFVRIDRSIRLISSIFNILVHTLNMLQTKYFHE